MNNYEAYRNNFFGGMGFGKGSGFGRGIGLGRGAGFGRGIGVGRGAGFGRGMALGRGFCFFRGWGAAYPVQNVNNQDFLKSELSMHKQRVRDIEATLSADGNLNNK